MLAEGYEQLTAELKVLRAERPKIDAIEEARAMAICRKMLSIMQKRKTGQVEAQISDLEDRVSRVQIMIRLSTGNKCIGATVTLLDEDTNP